jgi:ankyrin repeat protein
MDDFLHINERLFAAVESNDAQKVQDALKDERLHAGTYFGYRSIISAAKQDDLEILKILLESSAKIDRKSFWSNSYKPAYSTLKYAASAGRIELMKLLLVYDEKKKKKDLREAFIEALMSGNLEITKMLLDAGANVNIKDEKGITPLMCAVLFPSKNQETLIEWLLTAGAHVQVKRETWVQEGKTRKRETNTALTYAIQLGNDKIVDMLKNAKKYRK